MKKLLELLVSGFLLATASAFAFAGQGMSPGMGQVAYNTGSVAIVDAGASTSTGTSVSSLALAATVTSGANMLLVQVATNDGTAVSGVTYTINGSTDVALTKAGAVTANWYGNLAAAEVWYLPNPQTGVSYNITVTWSAANNDRGFGWTSYSGVASVGTVYTNSSPLDGHTNPPVVTVSDWATGDMATGVTAVNAAGVTLTSDNTQRWSFVSTGQFDNHASGATSSTTGVMSWGTGATDVTWATVGVALKP